MLNQIQPLIKTSYKLGEYSCKLQFDKGFIFRLFINIFQNSIRTDNSIKIGQKFKQTIHQKRWQISMWKYLQHYYSQGNFKLKTKGYAHLLECLKYKNTDYMKNWKGCRQI